MTGPNDWDQLDALVQMAKGLVEDAERDVEALETIREACRGFENVGAVGIDVDESQRPWRITVDFTVSNLDVVLEENPHEDIGTPLADLWEMSDDDHHPVTYDEENHWWQGSVVIDL